MKSKLVSTFLILAGLFAGWSSAAAADGPRVITITANDTMKFDTVEITAKAGEQVTIHFQNKGAMPKLAMGHNWVLLTAGNDGSAFAAAAAAAAATEYIPAAQEDKIIAHTKLLGPGESAEVTFTVPSTPGNYVYLCSFPGHFQVGMKGILKVE